MNNKFVYTLSAIILLIIALPSCKISQKKKNKKCDCPGLSILDKLYQTEMLNLNYLNEKKSNNS